MAKTKKPKPGTAERVLELISKFRETAKGDADRGHFNSIVSEAISGRLMTKEDAAKLGVSFEKCSKALQGQPTDAHVGARTTFIAEAEKRANALIAAR